AKIHLGVCYFAIRVTWASPIGMKGFAMWDWGHRVTWGVGGVNGTVQVRGSAQERAVGRWAFWREIRLVVVRLVRQG
nr:hypothetical protein [Tanacetum cinerariifolium]